MRTYTSLGLAGVLILPALILAQGPSGRLTPAPDTINFYYTGGQNVLSETVFLRRIGPFVGGMTFTTTVTTSNGVPWLTVTPPNGPIPDSITVSASPAGLPAGTYNGQITVAVMPPIAPPATINVVFRVLVAPGGTNQNPPPFVRPGSLTFVTVQGTNPPAQTLALSSPTGGASFTWTAAAQVNSPQGATWLQVSPISGSGPATLTVSVNAAGLAVGQYAGFITVTSGNVSAQIPVGLGITPPGQTQPKLTVNPLVFSFVVAQGEIVGQATRTLSVGNAGTGPLSWTASVTSGGEWLSISPTSGTTPSTITLTLKLAGLAPGEYTGAIQVTAAGQTETVRVFLRVLPASGISGRTGIGRSAVQIMPPVVVFNNTGGAPTPASVPLQITSRITGLSFSATKSTGRGNWLNISPTTGSIPGTINVTANVTGLAPGIYTGLIAISITGSVSERRSVPVILQVGPMGLQRHMTRLRARPGAVVLRAAAGATAAQSAQVSLQVTGAATMTYTAAASMLDGKTWLTVSPASGTAPGASTIQANPTGLAAGIYRGAVVFEATGGPALPGLVLVTLLVGSGAPRGPAITSLDEANQSSRSLFAVFLNPTPDFISTALTPMEVTVAVFDSFGQTVEGAEVRISSSNGEPAFLLEDVGEGVYTGIFRSLKAGPAALSATAASEGLVSATSTVGGDLDGDPNGTPVIYQDGVVSAASFAPGETPVAPGSVLSLFGRNLVNATAVAQSTPLPRELGGVRVLVGGVPAPILSVFAGAPGGDDQINFQAPFELAALSYADVVVEKDGLYSSPEAITIAAAMPALFTLTQSGRGPAAALHPDYGLVNAQRPARPGDTVLLYGTGLGEVRRAPASGESAAGAESTVTREVRVTIGGKAAAVTFAGLAPGFVGLYQINVTVPAGIAAGEAAVEITVGGIPSGQAVTLAVGN